MLSRLIKEINHELDLIEAGRPERIVIWTLVVAVSAYLSFVMGLTVWILSQS